MDVFAPWHIAVLLIVLVVLFGAKRLPGAAESLGKSMHIFRKSGGVRGSSEITLRTARSGREGQQGSAAKRWSRRTRAQVEGKIESRGVGLVYPVGGKPGAQAQVARSRSQGKPRGQVGKGLKRATGRDE